MSKDIKADATAPRRIVALDIGSVTCRMLIADVDEAGLHELYRGYAITNLGEDVDATGFLKPEAMQRVVAQIERFQEVIRTYEEPDSSGDREVTTVTIATSASRDAKNADEFRTMLAAIGIEPTIISGDREAYLSFLGASHEFKEEDLAVIDIGGGSTEVVFGRTEALPDAASVELLLSHSFNVGCRRVTEKFFTSDPPSDSELEQARRWILENMEAYFLEARERGFAIERVVAVAGTATTVVSIEKKMLVYDSSEVHRTVVGKGELIRVFDRLRRITLEERKQVVGLDPDRASVIVAGLLILIAVLDMSDQSSFTASESDILQGIVLDAVLGAEQK